MPENEDRIAGLVANGMADRGKLRIATHEAGHAVVALHLGLQLISVDIKEREDTEGEKQGLTTVKGWRETFSAQEVEQHSPQVVARVKQQVTFLLAAAAATSLIFSTRDPRAQHDLYKIVHLCREFPEIDGPELEKLGEVATAAVTQRRAEIETVASELVEQLCLSGDEVRQLVGIT